MKSSKLLFTQIFTCAFAIGLAFSLYSGILNKARQSGVVLISVMLGFIFAAILVAGGIGILGALLTKVAKSKKELALRLACGASPLSIVKTVMLSWVLRFAAVPTLTGLISVTVALLVFGKEISSLISFEVSMSAGNFACSFLGIVLFCALAAVYPAFKAARTNIIEAISS